MRVLKSNELEQVSGGWIAHAAGAILGGYAGGYGYLAGGGKSPDGFRNAVIGGAAGGALSPVRGIASGATALASGVVGGAVNTYLSK
ncbi:class IIb bacteriocin, lactobin A/cerein 7B family [Neisseria yangbaofengii]|uniref:class IIb bacteriocin, lactobin A/cerein 7B family n=1 Tax=Neisseria yangbaofengii TaxID=2709396 RepID=UPI0013ED3BA2|nr:class IIb bacteriocin, lactobin A/cerein 7B family [Neisseria yangbaofengii]